MADIEHLRVNGETYDISDPSAREGMEAAQEAAATAQSTADQAVKDAASAQETADSAASAAANAQSTADSATSAASAAQSTADQAVKDAATAQETADTATTAAANAQTTAEMAQTFAFEAADAAGEAQFTADAAKSGLTDGSVTKVGTSTVGSDTNPIYIDSGTPTKCTDLLHGFLLSSSISTGDCDDLTDLGIYEKNITKSDNLANSPGIYAYLINFGYERTDSRSITQIAVGYNVCNIYMRYRYQGKWSSWRSVDYNAQETANSAASAAATAQSTADQAASDASAAQKSADAAQSTADQAMAGLTDGSVTKVGTSTVGGAAKPIYLSSGTPTACSSTVGSSTNPVYLNSGTITACSLSDMLIIDNFEIDNISISANSSENGTLSVSKSGYTPLAVAGVRVTNASSSGSGGSLCAITYSYLSGSTYYWRIRNTHSSTDAKILINPYILYLKTS